MIFSTIGKKLDLSLEKYICEQKFIEKLEKEKREEKREEVFNGDIFFNVNQ